MPAPAARVATVTGAARGIGLAISRRLVSDGWQVAGLDLDKELLVTTSKQAGVSLAVEADVTDTRSIERAFAQVESKLGPLCWV
jgi:NAD(P)-dependent dehydrogenase (short-subunit alcohol dehydrogenase family)